MGGLAIGMFAASAITGAMASTKAGRANRKAAEKNAQVARIQAKQALQLAETDVDQIQEGAEFLAGEQVAAFAGQNIDLGSDVVTATSERTQTVIDDEIATVRNNARLKSWGLEVQAQQDVTAGRSAQRAGNWQAVGSILGGASQMAMVGGQMKAGTIK